MFQKFLFVLALLPALIAPVLASELPYTDVAKNVSWYGDLQNMYNAWVVSDNKDHLFRPEWLLPRDEFVGIVVGVGCRKCVYPTIEDVLKYNTDPFADIIKKNPYFYCISYAKEQWVVQGYNLDGGTMQCQDKKQTFTSTPFCPANSITRIEAAAVLLRQANLWDETLNSTSFDRKRVIADVDAYWYGYALKAIETGLIKIGSDNKITPGEYITRREFVIMAGKIFSMNLCQIKPDANTQKNSIASAIFVYDKEKNSNSLNPSETKFPNRKETVYDLKWYGGGSGPFTYEWEFHNTTTGETKQASGQYLDNYNLWSAGVWTVRLNVTDSAGNASSSYRQIVVEPSDNANNNIESNNSGSNGSGGSDMGNLKKQLSVIIQGKPIDGISPLPVDFTSTVGGGNNSYSYAWDFWDGSYSSVANPSHVYERSGVYTVVLIVHDLVTGNVGFSQVVVQVIENPDRDGDGVLNTDDLCPDVYGTHQYSWCPKVDEYRSPSSRDGSSWDSLAYSMGVNNKCLADKINNVGAIQWSLQCVSCPCAYAFDFANQVRECDIIFPSILSPDKKSVYSRGWVYQLK